MKINLPLFLAALFFTGILCGQESLLPPPAEQPVWTYVNSGFEWPPQNYRVQFRYADDHVSIGDFSYRVIESMRLNLNGDTLVNVHAYVREEGGMLWGNIYPDPETFEEVKMMDTTVEPGGTVLLHSFYDDYEEGHIMTLTAIEEVEGEDGVWREMYSFENTDADPQGGSIRFIKGIGFTDRPFGGVNSTMHDLYHLQCLYFDENTLAYFESDPSMSGIDPDATPDVCGVLGPLLSAEARTDRPVIKLYPNPVRDRLFFDLPEGETGLREVRITDMTGRLVLQRNGGLQESVEVEHLPPGIYLINITTRTGLQSVAKFVKAE